MTLPSSKFRPTLRDPDRLAEMPHKEVKFSDPLEEVRRIPNNTGIDGQYQDYKRREAHKMALAYMDTNKSKNVQRNEAQPWKYDQKRVGLAPFGRSDGIYNATKNPFIGVSGGVLSTKEGQIFKSKKLSQRIKNLDERDAVSSPLSGLIPTNSKTSQVEYTPPQSLVEIETILNELLSAISTLNYSAIMVEEANRFYRVLQTKGVELEQRDLVRILRVIDEQIREVLGLLTIPERAPRGLSADRFKIAENTVIILFRTRNLLKGLIGVSERSPRERKLALPGIITSSLNVPQAPGVGRIAKREFYDQLLLGSGLEEGDSEEECMCDEKKKLKI